MKTVLESVIVRVALIFVIGMSVLVEPEPVSSLGETFIVKDSKPAAEIIISETSPRMTRLAAEDLQTYVSKITGAKLPITTRVNDEVSVHIYVGKSAYTDRMGITDEGLKHGAFKMVSGDDYLVLLGRDRDFKPKEPYLRGYGDKARLMSEWDSVTGEKWGFPFGNLYKEYNRDLNIWEKDERGSFNAVCEFLRMQGVRWYLPGELGEIVPKKSTIALPVINRTVIPDFAMRYPFQYFRMFGHEVTSRDEVMWQLRIGLNHACDLVGVHQLGHGINPVHSRDEVKKAHPEYYALYSGRRDTETFGGGRPCLSSQGLFDANVKYIRKLFDLYDAPMVSVMPQDGYTTACECSLCSGKSTPERGWKGQISDYVWEYVDRVAREVNKTHPDKKVSCLAYGTYLLPPTKIDKLSPNIVVGIAQSRLNQSAPDNFYEDVRKAWLDKMPKGGRQLWIWEYYLNGNPRNSRVFMPVFFPHSIARDLKSLKNISLGEFVEVYRDQKSGIEDLAVTHLNFYVTSRLWWDADEDIDALLEEYYSLFYGPARDEMRDFIKYSEANYLDMDKTPEKIAKVFDLLGRAVQKAPAGSVFAKRIKMIADYIKPMKDLQAQLEKGRQNVPEVRIASLDNVKIRIDGRLDDEEWKPLYRHTLRHLSTGHQPEFKTSFKTVWSGDSLYLGIKCDDPDAGSLGAKLRAKDDAGIWNGDNIEILIETQNHSYYQIVIDPAGSLADLDRKSGLETRWSSGAEIATLIGPDSWTAEVRLPVAAVNQEDIDPLNGISGRRPTEAYPWFFNICRQRIHGGVKELSCFSPTGMDTFHDSMKFGKIYVR